MKINSFHRNRNLFFVVLLSSLFFAACDKTDAPVEPSLQSRGQILNIRSGLVYPALLIQKYLTDETDGMQLGFVPQYSVQAYSVDYVTVDTKGNLVKASGAMYIPFAQDNLPLISFQHGTVTARTQAPSQNLTINALESLVTASLGYFAIEPDYLGLGESTILHPYLYAKSSADAVIDFIKAGRELAKTKNVTLNGQVFLAGYSEGGYVTLAAQKEIEKNYRSEINITASAPMAGPYDINLSIRTSMQNKIYTEPAYIAFLFDAYNDIYGWNRLDEFFNSQYASIIPSLFDGTKNNEEINAALTEDLTKLFKTEFLDSYLGGKETSISDAFASNSLIDWTPLAPIKLFHGNADEYVPYQNSVEALNAFKANGANVELVTIEGGTHLSSAIISLARAINWFGSLKLENVLAKR
jgi:pimeloyl-ACP methyl ester carboxylesterase